MAGRQKSKARRDVTSRVAYLQSYGNTVRTQKPPGPIQRWFRRMFSHIAIRSTHGGNNWVLFGGRAITGRDGWAFFVSQLLLVIPCVLFAVFV
jgi:hypothetical protein